MKLFTTDKLLNTIAKEKAKEGHRVEILPKIHIKEKEKRNKLLTNYTHHPKDSDLKIDGEYVDIKQPIVPMGENAISNNIRKGG